MNDVQKDIDDLMALTGAKREEILRMRWCDIDTTGKFWSFSYIRDDGIKRIIAIDPKSRAILERYHKSESPNSPIFSSES